MTMKNLLKLFIKCIPVCILIVSQIAFSIPASAQEAGGYVRVIVELDGTTLSEMQPQDSFNELLTKQDLQIRRDNFLKTVEQHGISLIPIREYQGVVFNGFSAWVSADELQALQTLPGVVEVSLDGEVQATDETSNEQIGAPVVWNITDANHQAVTGQGVVVAILDTGIDYTHPDLGGCFGPACRVTGGYDFINADNDPMDDFSHGTLVAGIIGANGTLKGVAPDVKFRAYKVLDEAGHGYYSTILAGFDQAVGDQVNIINMSLGSPQGSTTPDSSLCKAIDRAVAKGVTVTISAGNNGYNRTNGSRLPFSMGYPGICPSAISVANSSGDGRIASLSSAGPVIGFPKVGKPDIAAPGEMIYSTYPDGLYKIGSGTSMAAPQVAGAVALLKQLHPNWTPLQFKTVLMNNTQPEYIMTNIEQGAGFMRVDWAATAPAIVSPARYDFGKVNPSGQVQTGFGLTNLTDKALSVDASISAHLVMTDNVNVLRTFVNIPSTQISVSSTHLNIADSSSEAVTVAIHLSSLPSGYYEGVLILVVNASGDSQSFTLRVPVSFWSSPDEPIHLYQYLPAVKR